jgi:hypothetical protein
MVTGHFQKIGTAIADAATGPLPASQRRTALTSASVVLAFALGVGTGCGFRRTALGPTALGAALRRLPAFTALGAAYAALVMWGDRTAKPGLAPVVISGPARELNPPRIGDEAGWPGRA